ncbi:MAG: RluA family pseudouridine synthase [Clostridia bacterium]|nr:RluA family pseudouridine synthase [Clostridia bacterium]
MTASREDGVILFAVSEEWVGKRLDVLVAEQTELTRSAAARLIEDGAVTVNEKKAAKNDRLRAGDCVEITLPEPEPCEAVPQDIPLDVVYEDSDIIVVNKPCGMVVHPAAGNPDGTLVNALLWHCKGSLSGVGGVVRPGIVHRIDKETEGLLVVAKNDAAHLKLAEDIKVHRVNRIYYAIAIGSFPQSSGTVDAPIGRHPTDRKRMAVIRGTDMRSRPAVTHWTVLAEGAADGNRFTLLRCELETGRTHQIRVHLASIGHPLLGDPVYGGDKTTFEARHRTCIQGQCLHAGELHFQHPITGEEMHLSCKMSDNMQKTVSLIFGKDCIPVL